MSLPPEIPCGMLLTLKFHGGPKDGTTACPHVAADVKADAFTIDTESHADRVRLYLPADPEEEIGSSRANGARVP